VLDDSMDEDQMSIRIMNGCWLCEEWREMKFEWIDSKFYFSINLLL